MLARFMRDPLGVYVSFMPAIATDRRSFMPVPAMPQLLDIGAADGPRLHRIGRRDLRPVRHLRRPVEARLTMVVAVLYIAATVAVTVYMLVALLRPEDF
jgi:hypothetical protein